MNDSFSVSLRNWLNSNSSKELLKNTDALAKESASISYLNPEMKKDCIKLFKDTILANDFKGELRDIPLIKWSLLESSNNSSSFSLLLIKLKKFFVMSEPQIGAVLSEMINPELIIINAVKDGDLEFIEEISHFGIDFNKGDADGMTALHWAATLGNYEILTVLLKSGADPNLADDEGYTALMQAAAKGFKSCVMALVENEKINVNQTNKSGYHALLLACGGEGDLEIVKILLNLGSDTGVSDEVGDTALIHAAARGYVTCVRALVEVEKINVNQTNKLGQPALLLACVEEGNKDVVKVLLDHGADPSIADNDGDTALMQAAANGYTNCVKALMASGRVDINQINKRGRHALFMACEEEENEEMVKLLLDHHVDINMQDNLGRTVLVNLTLFNSTPSNERVIRMLVDRLDSKMLLFHKEILRLIAVAHSVSGVGCSQIKVNGKDCIPVELEGGSPKYWMKKMSKATNEFSMQYPEILQEDVSRQLIQMLNSGIFDSNHELLKRHSEGLPILLDTGFKGHVVSALIWKNCFILCNRGEGFRKVTEAFRFDTKALNVEILKRITRAVGSDEIEYSNLFFKYLPHILTFKPLGDDFEKKCSLPLQTAGNCSWASSELAVLAFLMLNELDKGKDVEIKTQFSEWAAFNQLYHLERYLGTRHIRKQDPEKDKTSLERRSLYELDNRLLLTAMKSIVRTLPKNSERLGNLNHILAKTLGYDEELTIMGHLEAKKVINALFKSNAKEVIKKYTDEIRKPEDHSSGENER